MFVAIRMGDEISLMEYIIVALGDSLTYGYPYSPGSSWVSLAAEELALTIHNRGVNGETSLEMQARLESDVLALKPDAVIILAGSNDALGLREVITWDRTRQALQAMARRIKADRGEVIFVLPPPVDEPLAEARLKIQRKWLQEEAALKDLRLLDFYTPLLAESGFGIKPELTVDGLHPNKNGYKVLAQAAVAGLRRLKLGGLMTQNNDMFH
jgi:acyl-CoA thioesterase-1